MNIDSVLVGIVLWLDDLERSGELSLQLYDYFLMYLVVVLFFVGGELLEYGCYFVVEGGVSMQYDLVVLGFLIVGDVVGFMLNIGFMVWGMDFVVGFVFVVVKLVDLVLCNYDVGYGILDGYIFICNESFVGCDMNIYWNVLVFLEFLEMYDDVGQFVVDVMYKIYGFDMIF